ncbi:ATP/GTP-binding protein [Hydrogenimonas sp.]
MTSLSSLNATANSFGFTLQTSSGDTIELSMYDNKSVSFSEQSGEGTRTTTMSLRHEFGYRFHYEGNGIDAQDKKEIEDAMKLVKPMFQKFLESVKKSDEMPGFKELTNVAQLLKSELPKPQTPDGLNMLKDKTVDTMDGVLALFKRNDKLIESAKALFDRLFDESRGFDYFA